MLLDFRSKNLDSIHLVDYGFATKFIDKKGRHLKLKEVDSFRGNFTTASADQMDFKNTSRRDDLISLVYFGSYLLNGDLPWTRVEPLDSMKEQRKLVLEIKKSSTLD